MKIKLLLTVLALFAMSVLNASCVGTSTSKAEDILPHEFSIVAKDEVGSSDIRTIKHNKTGCYYISSSGNGKALAQMFVDKNGVSVPYCPKEVQ